MNTYLISLFMLFNINQQAFDTNLYSWNHLNDGAHIGNLSVKADKEEILFRLQEFDLWYRRTNDGIAYYYGNEFWKNNKYWKKLEDERRISYVKDSIVPKLIDSSFLTQELKDKSLKNSKVNDPGNLGVLLSGTQYGKDLYYVTRMLEETGWYSFHAESFLDNFTHDELKPGPPRNISYEEAKFYHLSMIKMYNDSSAVYRIHHELTNMGGDWTIRGFLICELVKQEGEWLIDDVYYIEKEDLIKPEDWNGYTMFDYFKYKDAYENGTPVDAVPEDPYEYQKWWPYKQIK